MFKITTSLFFKKDYYEQNNYNQNNYFLNYNYQI